MIDIDTLKRSVDCRILIEGDLGKPKFRTRKYSSFKCPLHHERKGYSLVVYADHWHCYGKCGVSGDAIGWLMRYHGLSFPDACERLSNGNLLRAISSTTQPDRLVESRSEPPDTVWQKTARFIVEESIECLWGSIGQRAREYLQHTRGLKQNTIISARLGYIPGKPHEWIEIDGLKVPCGIAIPYFADDALWGIKVRRAAGDIRYQQVSGGNIKGCLYLADRIEAGLPLFLTEGEFDTLILSQCAEGLVSSASIGGAGNRRLNPHWYGKLLGASQILVRMDADTAGTGAAASIMALMSGVKTVQVPMGKDINEFYLLAGHETVMSWIRNTTE